MKGPYLKIYGFEEQRKYGIPVDRVTPKEKRKKGVCATYARFLPDGLAGMKVGSVKRPTFGSSVENQ